jgi:hypothetical protein
MMFQPLPRDISETGIDLGWGCDFTANKGLTQERQVVYNPSIYEYFPGLSVYLDKLQQFTNLK